MGQKISSKTRILRDIETGEIIETEEVIKVVQGRTDFEILYLDAFCQILNKLGGKRYQVLKYILEHRDFNNCVVTSVRKMANELNIAQATVALTMRVLRDLGVINYNHGGLTMVNPKIINRKSMKGERYLLQKFVEFQKEQNIDNGAETTERKSDYTPPATPATTPDPFVAVVAPFEIKEAMQV